MATHNPGPFTRALGRMVRPAVPLTSTKSDAWSMLTDALTGDAAALETMLREDPSLVDWEWGYFTPLHFAVRSGHADAVRVLLEHGADASRRTLGWQDSPLDKAKDRGYRDVAGLLGEHLSRQYQTSPAGSRIATAIRERRKEAVLRELDADPEAVDAGDERGNRPLHWAVLTRQLWLIDELLRRGADLHARRGDGATPVQLALEGDYWYRSNRDLSGRALQNPWLLAGYLVARGAEYDICLAAAAGDTEHVAALIEVTPALANKRNSVGRRPLSYAAQYGHAETVRLLLERGAEPGGEEAGAPEGRALWSAVKGGHEACVRLLLAEGANPNAVVEAGGNSLFIALQAGRDSLVNLLYAYGASCGLDSACCLGRIDLAGEILAANPSLVNTGGDYGPLCMAAGYGHADIVGLLIRSGADLNAPWYANNYMGYAMDHDPAMVRLLLEAGADPCNANWLGVTYLHKAAWRGDLEAARILLECGADLHALDEEYRATPLGWAAKYGHLDMVRYLLEQGANPEFPEGEEWASPLSWAKRRGHKEIAGLLEARR